MRELEPPRALPYVYYHVEFIDSLHCCPYSFVTILQTNKFSIRSFPLFSLRFLFLVNKFLMYFIFTLSFSFNSSSHNSSMILLADISSLQICCWYLLPSCFSGSLCLRILVSLKRLELLIFWSISSQPWGQKWTKPGPMLHANTQWSTFHDKITNMPMHKKKHTNAEGCPSSLYLLDLVIDIRGVNGLELCWSSP